MHADLYRMDMREEEKKKGRVDQYERRGSKDIRMSKDDSSRRNSEDSAVLVSGGKSVNDN